MAAKTKTSNKNGSNKAKEALLESTQNDQTQESENMAAKGKAALLESAASDPVAEIVKNYDFSGWTIEFNEGVGANTYPWGTVDLKAPDCPKFETVYEARKAGEAIIYGEESPMDALATLRAFSSLRLEDYRHIEDGFVQNGLIGERAAYVASWHSGNVTLNGQETTVPVPTDAGIQTLLGDVHFGFEAVKQGFIGFRYAKETLRKGDNMTEFEIKQMETFWKMHAIFSFQSFKWIRVELRYKSIDLGRVIVENFDDAEARNKAINGSIARQKEYKTTQSRSKSFKGGATEVTGYKGAEIKMHDVYLLVLKDVVNKSATIVDKVLLTEETVMTLNAKEFQYCEILDDKTARLTTPDFVNKPEDAKAILNTAASLGRSLYQVS